MKLPARLLGLLATLLMSGLSTADEAKVELPFDFVDGFIVISASLGDRAPVRLLVDSGAAVSMLDLQAAGRSGIPRGPEEPVQGVGSQCVAYHVPPIAVTSDRALLTRIGMAMDLSSAAELCRDRIDGLLGMDFFADRVVELDFGARMLRILPESRGDAGETLPIRVRRGVMCVPVAVNGSRTRWTRLDTGCNDALHWVIHRPNQKRSVRDVSIGFITEESAKSLTSVQLGSRTINPVVTALHGSELFPGEAGLLGNGLLSQHVVTIDAVRGELRLAPLRRR